MPLCGNECGYLRDAHHQFFRQLPQPGVPRLRLRIVRNAEKARQHADDIAVENGRGLIEGDAANRAGGLASDARQRQHVVKGLRKLAVVLHISRRKNLLINCIFHWTNIAC
jgi:hypothetical protein